MAWVKKLCNPGGGQEMAVMVKKNLTTAIQVNFVLTSSEAGIRAQIDLNCCLKFLPRTDHHSHFLADTWISQLFHPGHLV